MAINFTDSPADGATQVISGRTYTYNSAKNKWDTTATEVAGPTATVYATVNDLPGTATAGDQAFVSATNRLYIWNGSGWYNIALVNSTPTWSTQPDSSYTLASDGTATTITIVAVDPEGLPITYSIASDTSGDIATVAQGTGLSANTFTITPSTSYLDAGTFSLTFRASDGVNVASAISEFTLAFAVQNSNYTTALITSVGTNNQVNNTFVDSSTNSHTITAGGNVTQSTFSPYRHGGYSTYMDGGDRYYLSSSADWNLGSNWTVEGWFYPTTQPTETCRVLMFGTNATNNAMGLSLGSNLTWGGGGAFSNGGMFNGAAASLNEWQHVAWVRDGTNNTGTIYVNGVASAGSYSGPAVQSSGNVDLKIGYDTVSTVAYQYRGYIADLRITKNVVYTSSFTPPERFTSSDVLTDTKLLTFNNFYLKDESTSNHNISISAGNPGFQPFSPYDYETYSATDNGGSIYFDGSGDYLRCDEALDNSTSAGDPLTVEMWLYFPTGMAFDSSGFTALYGMNRASDGNNAATMAIKSSGFRWHRNNTEINLTYTHKYDTWFHFAVVYHDGTNGTTLYVNGESIYTNTTAHTTAFADCVFLLATEADSANGGSLGNYYNGYMSDVRVTTSAVYTSNFTPPAAPLTEITNTALLLRGTNAGIIDKSQSAKTLTLNGDVKSSTAQTKYLSSSMAFDGNGDIVLFDASDPLYNLSYGQGDFTLEGWFYFNSLSNNPKLYIDAASTSTYWQLYYVNNTGLTFRANNTGINVNAGSTLSVNTWYHIALVRNSSTYNIYVDGTSVVSTTTTHQIGSNGEKALGGSVISGATYSLNGYISDFRITKGLARYTANFTPPAAALQG